MEKSGKERIRASEGHSPPEECRQRVQVSEGHGEVRARKGFKQAKGTHHLKSTDVRTWKESN